MEKLKQIETRYGLVIFFLVFAVVCFSVGNILTKVASSMGLPGGEIAFVRFLVLAIFCLFPQNLKKMKFEHKPLLLIRGAAGGLSVVLTYIALAHLGVSLSKLLLLMLPVFAAIIAGIIWNIIPKFLTMVGLILTTVGVMIIVIVTTPSDSGYIINPWHIFPFCAAITGAASLVSIEAIQKRSIDRNKTEVDADILGAFGLIGVFFTIPFAFFENWIIPPSLSAYLLLGIISVSSIIGQLLMINYMRRVGSTTFSIIFQLSPVFTVALAWGFLGEILSRMILIGGSIALIGVFLATIKVSEVKLSIYELLKSDKDTSDCEHTPEILYLGDASLGIPATLRCSKCQQIIPQDWKLQAILISFALLFVIFILFLKSILI